MKVFIKGQTSPIELSKSTYKNSGGEADIHIKGGKAYKVYHDQKKTLPEGKIRELSVLTRPNIIKPEDILLDSHTKHVGYTMKSVPDSYTLCQLFPKPFRARNNVSPDNIAKLVSEMRSTIDFIHTNKILIVDLNEMNFLIDKKFNDIYFIDVDSYQTPNYPATAIMDSIRDRHASHFTRESDWFSFAIISFQMFRGIHPYKGGHPKYNSLDDRMLHNVSILNSSVKFPAGAVLPESVVPDAYKAWYRAVLEEGKRLPAPTDLVQQILVVTQPTIRVINGNVFDFIELDILSGKAVVGDVTGLYRLGQKFLVTTNQKVYNETTGLTSNFHGNVSIGYHEKLNVAIATHIDNGIMKFSELNEGHSLDCFSHMYAENMMEYDGRIYYKHEGDFIEVSFIGMTRRLLKPVGQTVLKVAEQSTQVFPGCIIENLLGSYYLSIFPAKSLSYQLRLKELDGYKIIDAKFDHGIAMIVGAKAGKYDRFILVLDSKFKSYTVRQIKDINYTGLNFVVLSNGICVSMNEDESIDVFTDLSNMKNLTDTTTSGIKLMKDENKVVVFKSGKFYQLKMK